MDQREILHYPETWNWGIQRDGNVQTQLPWGKHCVLLEDTTTKTDRAGAWICSLSGTGRAPTSWATVALNPWQSAVSLLYLPKGHTAFSIPPHISINYKGALLRLLSSYTVRPKSNSADVILAPRLYFSIIHLFEFLKLHVTCSSKTSLWFIAVPAAVTSVSKTQQ